MKKPKFIFTNINCNKCYFLSELFLRIKKPTKQDYFYMTSLFAFLHKGKNYCKPIVTYKTIGEIIIEPEL